MDPVNNRKEKIDNYILMTQVLFNLLILLIIFKSFEYGYTDFLLFQSLNFVFLFLCLIVTIAYVFFRGKEKVWLDFLLIVLDIILINIIVVKTNLYEARFLYSIPVLIVSIKYNFMLNFLFASAISLYNIVFDYFTVQHFFLNYSIETDLVLGAILIIFGWLVGSIVQVEKKVRDRLYKLYEKLLKQEIFIGKIVNEIPFSLLAIDQKRNISLINQPFLDFIQDPQKKPGDFIGQPYSAFCSNFCELSSLPDCYLIQALEEGKSTFKTKRVINNKLIEITSQPIFDDRGQITHALAIFEDVTEQERINQRITHLERLNSVGQMAASIAHEIKNPLTTIKGFLELGLTSIEYLDKENLKLLLSEVNRCNTIVTDFLSLARKNKKEKRKVNLAEIMKHYLPLIERDAVFNGIKVETEIEEVEDLYLDEGEIKQLLLNLTRNAIEAMPEDGLLTIRVKDGIDSIILEVEDTGIGMPKEVLEKIGTPFLTTKENGTGLGLTVCFHIAKNHKAEIKVTSKENVGTKFQVIFPKEME